ncbi:hypothetical protein [Pedobacter kyonggii]|uniref:Uncharacterized protein n=1 Tax=Pedobacter kyonggii TaxID=1926871 RepID=A0A4Q9H4J0_9SPHI|nr:hypothetical protein [Pedobacter kyonggii]TBO36381.1 hypothetical protein EYS08_24925 [Pedobacter kyonggii]
MKDANSLKISNQIGPIAQGTGFLPFGPVAARGSYLKIEFEGIAGVKAREISLKLVWLNLPTNFGVYFQGYQPKNAISNHSFYVDFYWNSGADLYLFNDRPLELFTEDTEGSLQHERVFDLIIDPKWIYSNNCSIKMALVGSEFAFGHAVYAEIMLKAALCAANGEQTELPNPPFTPKVKKLSLSLN